MMLLQVFITPQNALAEGDNSLPQGRYVKVGEINAKSYDAKIMNELNRIAARNRTSKSQGPGARLFSSGPYFGKNNEPKDADKPKYFGNVSAKLDLVGLDGNAFQWNEIFGVDEKGNPKPAQIIFRQMDVETKTDTGIQYILQITKGGKYTWSDGEGKPTKLPLFSKSLKPFKYEVRIDERVSDKVELLTSVSFGTEGSSPTFSPENEDGEIIANITLGLTYKQIASTKFKSEWHTDVSEADRPGMKANFAFDDEGDGVSPVNVDLPKNDKDTKIIRDWHNDFDPDLVLSIYLEKTPNVTIDETTQGLTFEENNGVKTVKSGDHKYKYDFTYDVINGGKLTMTEILPVTFDANGGAFASIADPNAEQKIVKEVDYDGTLTDKAETPTKPGKAFKGWATEANGTTPAPETEYKNLKAAKTFYAIWSDEDIQVEELVVAESLGSFPKKGPKFTNDFVPTFEDLKAQVKVKDANGNFGPLPETGLTFSIVDGTKEYTEDSVDLKKFLYDKVKENNKDEVSRTETVKAKITYSDGTTREIEIPIVVLKNIYRGSDQGNKLPHIPDDYVRVTIDPTNKAQDPDKTYYYVNPKAKVIVPGKDPVGAGDNKFSKWTIKADSDTVEADYTFGKIQIYTEASTITAQYGNGTIKIQYVDENDKEIDAQYQIDGKDYPSEKSGGLGKAADESDFTKKGPDFKGYIFNSRDSIKGKHYNDPADPNSLDTVKYRYNKKVTTDDKSKSSVHFKVVFDGNGGKFGTDTTKDVYVYFSGNSTPETVTFAEVREAVEEKYGKPTKDKAEFKEWQDKAAEGTKVADEYVVKVPNWDWTTYPETGYTPETFYAHYEQASALVKYLDLDGKPIGDEFKIEGVEYPTEKDGKAGEAIDRNVYTAETAPKLIGYKFNRIELNPANSKYALDNKATIKIYYEKLPDVIPSTGNEKPDGYVEVKFVPTDKAKDTTEKIFYVNPKKDVKISIADPVAKATYTFKEWKMGANADGAVYNPSTAQKFTEPTTVITATYEETENIIPYNPSVPDPMVRPDGYVRLTFAADPGLKLTEQKAYYVKANAGIKLGNSELVKPGYEAQTGYKFNKWDKEDTLEIEATDIVVTAKATKLDNVIPEKDETGKQNEKPEGYKEVTFAVKTGDEAKGSIEGVAKFYVNPTEYVTITPPTTKANTGFEFGAWDKDATKPTVYDKDATITGSFNGLKDVIPKTKDDDSEKPDGYKTVTFKIEGKGGSIVKDETKVYYVNPAKDVTVPQPKTVADTGYEFDKWKIGDQEFPTEAKKYTDDTRVKGNFKELDDIIPATKDDGTPNAKPDGYVTLTFEKGDHGSLTGQTLYYVNPKANPAKTLGDTSIVKPTVKAEVGYKFTGWNFADTKAIQSDITVTAQYESIDDVIPKDKPTGGENDKPEGYITVTFDKGAHGELEGNTTFYINPNKAVMLEDKAPTIKPNTGYTSAGWDTSINKAIQYKDGDKITALYNEPGNISETKVAGYVKVEFKPGTNGTLDGTTNYWIKPGVEVNIPAPTVKPNVGYKFDKWDKSLTVTAKANDSTYEITATYAELDTVIPKTKTDDSEKPNGYVTVTFTTDGNGSLEGTTTYFVNPNKEADFTQTAANMTKKPKIGYTEKGGSWSPTDFKKTFKANAEFKFSFKKLDDVIPAKEGEERPEGYVTLTLIPTDKATDQTKANKSFWVKANTDISFSSKPTGKEETLNGITYTHTFKGWTVTRGTIASWSTDTIAGKFIQDTEITAQYTTKVKIEKLTPAPVPKKNAVTPINDVPKPEDLIKNVPGSGTDPLPEGTEITYKQQPKVDGTGKTTAKVEVKYPNGKTVVVEVPITVVDNVVPQTGDEDGKKPLVPDNYVKVTVDTTDKATDNTKFTKVFWVKPDVEVTIPNILAPTGKPETVDGVTKTNKFVKWQRQGVDPKIFYETEIKDTFAGETTIIATYEQDKNVEPKGKDNPWIPQNSNPRPQDFIENPYDDNNPNNKDNLPPRTKFEFVPGTEPNTGEPGEGKTTTIKVIYPNGETKEVPVKYRVTGDVVEQKDPNKKPDVPDNFVEVIVKTTAKATEDITRTFWVNPDKEVTIPVKNPQGGVMKDAEGNPVKDPAGNEIRYNFDHWKPSLVGTFKQKTTIEAQYTEPTSEPDITAGMITTYVGTKPTTENYQEVIKGVSFETDVSKVEITTEPDVSKVGMTKAEIKITFKNGDVKMVPVPVKVLKKETRPGGSSGGGSVIPSKPEPKPEKPSEGDLNKDDHYQYLIGYPDGTFAPNRGMTRAEVATMFTRLLKDRPVKWLHYSSGLSDIYAGDWYADTVGYAVEKGIVSGYPDGTFKPNQPITRAEFASIASRFAQLTDDQDISFIDLDASHWGYKAVRSAASHGWISGYPDGSFRPEQAISRAEVTSITNRMLNRYADLDWIDAHRNEVIRFSDVDRSDWFFEPVMEATMGHDFTRDADGKTEHWTGLNGKTFI